MNALPRILLVCLLCCAAAAPGEAVSANGLADLTAAEAFIDDPNLPPGAGTPLSIAAGAGAGAVREVLDQLDLGATAPGLHVLFTRFQDVDGNWSAPVALTFERVAYADVGQLGPADQGNTIAAAEVFFDHDDPGEGAAEPLSIPADDTLASAVKDLLDSAPVASLDPGLHTVHLRVRDTTDTWSAAIAWTFERVAFGSIDDLGPAEQGNGVTAAEVFFDDKDPGEGAARALTVPADGILASVVKDLLGSASVASLDPGLHTVHLRVRDTTGTWSAAMVWTFERVAFDSIDDLGPVDGRNNIAAAEVFFDVDPGEGNGTPLTDTVNGDPFDRVIERLQGQVSTAGLATGLHTLNLRIRDQAGNWSISRQENNYVPAASDTEEGRPADPPVIIAAQFRIDDGDFQPLSAVDGGFGGVQERVDHSVAATDGLHAVRIRFQDATGAWSDTGPPLPVNPIGPDNDQDWDWDGLPDDWERHWFGTLDLSRRDDPDGDGLDNRREFESGRDPLLSDDLDRATLSGFIRNPQG